MGSKSFDCDEYRGLENVEENSDGLRTSVMVMVKEEDEDGLADHLPSTYLTMYHHPA